MFTLFDIPVFDKDMMILVYLYQEKTSNLFSLVIIQETYLEMSNNYSCGFKIFDVIFQNIWILSTKHCYEIIDHKIIITLFHKTEKTEILQKNNNLQKNKFVFKSLKIQPSRQQSFFEGVGEGSETVLR